MNLQVPSKELETTTVTLNEIIYHRRVRVLDHAGVQVSARPVGPLGSRTRATSAGRTVPRAIACRALMAKACRSARQPNSTPAHVVEIVLAEPIARPTLGARRLLEDLAKREVVLSASGVQRMLLRHNLGHRRGRAAALAQITATETGLVTDDARNGPFGFCHFAARPRDLVALDTFYVGKLKGVASVFQLNASVTGAPSRGG